MTAKFADTAPNLKNIGNILLMVKINVNYF
jgi:hypothetical protein